MMSNSFQQSREISTIFINQASDILGDTTKGLTGSQIVESLRAYAVESNIDIPFYEYPFS